MKTQIQKQENVSHTIQTKTKAANQASIAQVLQKYRDKTVQREASPEEDELLQGKFETAQREELDDEEPVQGKFTAQCMAENPTKVLDYAEARRKLAKIMGIEDKTHKFHKGNFNPKEKYNKKDEKQRYEWIAKNLAEHSHLSIDTAAAVTQLKSTKNETGLPNNLKSGIENLSGYSMDDVRVHYHSLKPAQLQALAYTQGTDIHVAPGQEKHLPHEAWHVVQQKQGRVQPTMQLQGVNVNDNAGLEHEADVMGGKAIQLKVNEDIIQGQFKAGSGNLWHVHKDHVKYKNESRINFEGRTKSHILKRMFAYHKTLPHNSLNQSSYKDCRKWIQKHV
jgi:hypothetical protein